MVTFTEEILNGKLHFLCSDTSQNTTARDEALNYKNIKFDKAHQKKKKAIVIGDSLINTINELGLSISKKVLVKNFPGAASEKIAEKMDEVIKEKPASIIIHAVTNDLTKNHCTKNEVFRQRYISVDLKICQHVRLHIKTPFTFSDMST